MHHHSLALYLLWLLFGLMFTFTEMFLVVITQMNHYPLALFALDQSCTKKIQTSSASSKIIPICLLHDLLPLPPFRPPHPNESSLIAFLQTVHFAFLFLFSFCCVFIHWQAGLHLETHKVYWSRGQHRHKAMYFSLSVRLETVMLDVQCSRRSEHRHKKKITPCAWYTSL